MHCAPIASDLRIATRTSPLALAQARRVADLLTGANPGLGVEFVEVDSTGDEDQVTAVTALTEIGAFVRSVQSAVLEGEADVAVHSCKDLPVAGPEGLVVFYPEREEPWDALCGSTLEDLRPGARVGTGSPRRSSQLEMLRPDIAVTGIRGNVGTRLSKVDSGEFDAVVLAKAGLRRIDREADIGQVFTLDEMVPAPAQAILAAEAVDGSDAARLLQTIDDPNCRLEAESERLLLALTGAGCRSALGALARAGDGGVEMTGYVDEGGRRRRADVQASDSAEAAEKMRHELGL